MLCSVPLSKCVITVSLTPGALQVLRLSSLHAMLERKGTVRRGGGGGRQWAVWITVWDDLGWLVILAGNWLFSVRPLAAPDHFTWWPGLLFASPTPQSKQKKLNIK